jgi:hypothetical protein
MRFSTAAAVVGMFCAVSFAGVQAFQLRQTGPRTARQSWPPSVSKTPEKVPPLSAEDELKTIVLPPGYHAQLVAKEPLVVDPILTQTRTRPWTDPELQGGRGGRGGPGRGGD